jgi:hypothetical protein
VFGLNSEIEFEPTDHVGLWDEEATCRILVFEADGVSGFFRFSVAIEAGVVEGLDEREIRDRLRAELVGDLRRSVPEALGMIANAMMAGWVWSRDLTADPVWRKDALRRLGYHSLAPHGMSRLGGEPAPDGEELWRRTLR